MGAQVQNEAQAKFKKLHKKLKKIRDKDDLKIRPTKHLKTTFTDFDGSEKPLKIRYYQAQGILHLVSMRRFVLGDDTGLGKCQPYDTLVLTDQGLLQMGEIEDWSEMEPDSFQPMSRPVHVLVDGKRLPIKNFYYGGVKPTITATTRYGFRNTGSRVHPMRVFRKGRHLWVQAQDLQEGDHLCIERREMAFPEKEPVLPSGPTGMTPSFARFLGYYVGEGSLTSKYQIQVSQSSEANPEIHADILSLFQECLGATPKHPEKPDLYLNSVILRRWLASCGLGYTLSPQREVPACILQATKSSSREFLRALFEGEAHAGKSHIEYSTASEQLGRQVQIMLLRFGVVACRTPKYVRGHEQTYWRLTLCGADAQRFQEKIGFISTRKQEALSTCLNRPRNTNHDVVPEVQWVFEQVREDLLRATSRQGDNRRRKGSGLKQFGVSLVNTLNNIRNYGRNPSYTFVEGVVELLEEHSPHSEALEILKGFLCSRYFYDPVESLEDGEYEVFDIEVDDPSHCFVGNGLVNHNTLETIGALCYVWEKEPDRKVIVLTNKSATAQWVKEFSKFTTGVRVITCKGTPAKRKAARKFWEQSTGPTVMVMGYRSAVQDFTRIQPWKDYVVVFDECFQYHTPVTLADGTTELIGKIVSQRQAVEVLSVNPESGAVEPRRVVQWHRNPLFKGRRKNLLHLEFRFGGTVRVTKTHKFYTPAGGEVAASGLRKGSVVQHLCTNIPSPAQWQVILGGLLGDSSISHPKRPRWGICFGHSTKQTRYLEFKRDVLTPLGVSVVDTAFNGGYPTVDDADKGYSRFRLDGNEAVTSFLMEARVQRTRKRVTLNWLDRIEPLGLAVWYADDGSLSEHTCKDGTVTRRIILNTQGFSRDEVELLAGWLRWKWGVAAQVKTTKPRSDRPDVERKSYPYIYLDAAAALVFLDLLPCGFPGVEYKFPGKPIQDVRGFDLVPRKGLVTDWLTKKTVWTPANPDKDQYVYNLEVEGNHNFFAGGSLVSNCTAFKNPKTQVHQVCKYMAQSADRAWGLSATLIKNHLMEGYGIYQVVMPGLFGMTERQFMFYYCLTRMQQIPRSNRQVPIIVGYLPEKIKEFKEAIDPYFLGRPKHKVASELPVLIRRVEEVALTDEQEAKYAEALGDLFELGDGTVKEVNKLTAIAYCQQIANDLELLGIESPSPKLSLLLDLLTEGDFADENVIVYTRFRKMVDIIAPALKAKKVKAIRVTGAENEEQRQKGMNAFQDPNDDTRVALLTDAGAEAINLQAAKAVICFDTPWSAGNFLQLVGRMVRIGSVHDRCYVIHLVSRWGGGKAIDQRVLTVLDEKMNLVEAVLGKRLKGEGDEVAIDARNEISDLFDGLKRDAENLS